MSVGMIIQPYGLPGTAFSAASGGDPAFPAAALADPQPKVVARLLGGAATELRVDLGGDAAIDAVGLLFASVKPGAIASLFGSRSADGPVVVSEATRLFGPGPTAFAPAPDTRPRMHVLFTGPRAVARYLAIRITDAAPVPASMDVGVVLVGTNVAPVDPDRTYDLGSSRGLADQSEKRRLPDGSLHIERGAIVPTFRAAWSNLADADRDRLWTALRGLGESRPLLLVEHATGGVVTHDMIHYGVLERVDRLERTQPNKSKIELTLEEWL